MTLHELREKTPITFYGADTTPEHNCEVLLIYSLNSLDKSFPYKEVVATVIVKDWERFSNYYETWHKEDDEYNPMPDYILVYIQNEDIMCTVDLCEETFKLIDHCDIDC